MVQCPCHTEPTSSRPSKIKQKKEVPSSVERHSHTDVVSSTSRCCRRSYSESKRNVPNQSEYTACRINQPCLYPTQPSPMYPSRGPAQSQQGSNRNDEAQGHASKANFGFGSLLARGSDLTTRVCALCADSSLCFFCWQYSLVLTTSLN